VNVLARLGYVNIKVGFPYRETPYAQPIKDFWNFAMSFIFGYRKFAFPKNMMEIYARRGNHV
jgi:hypothetical protein